MSKFNLRIIDNSMKTPNLLETPEYQNGLNHMKNSSVSICSIVRDCERNLKDNIKRVESLRKLFKDSEVVIFENDSKDKTKEILSCWKQESTNVIFFSENFNSVTIPTNNLNNVNRFFSIFRIEKMARFRNKYMEYMNNSNFIRNYVIVIDLDISDFNVDGIIHSFGTFQKWDCISANGISLSKRLKWQYHDSYAFIPEGKIEEIQTEDIINRHRKEIAYLKAMMPILKVDSAYGGLAIYKWNSIEKIFYSYIPNCDEKVESKCEHVSLHMQMKKRGYGEIFINPSMIVKYRSLTLRFILENIKSRMKKIFLFKF